MAIAKMKKIKLISLQDQKDSIMQAIQGMQSVELIDMTEEYEQSAPADSPKRDVLNNSIKVLEGKQEDYKDALIFLKSYLPQPTMLEKMREPRKKMTIQSIEGEASQLNQEKILQEVDVLRKRIKKIEETIKKHNEDETFLLKWKKLSFNPETLSDNKFVLSLTGTIPQTKSDDYIRALNENPLIFVEEVYQAREEYGVSIYFDRQVEEEVKDFLEENYFFKLSYLFDSPPEEELVRIRKDRDVMKQELSEIKTKLADMKKTEWELMLINETIYAKLQRLYGQLLLLDERHLFILEGWMEDSKLQYFQEEMAEHLSQEDYAILTEDVKEEEIDKVPIVLKNNRFVSPFENITAMYSLPKYNEIDPTPFLTPFYLIFFGMMLADLGYGLLMWAATMVALKFFHLDKGMKKNMRFFNLLSYATMGWGLIYGSFFGAALPIVLLSTTEDVNTILLMSVIFGVIQMLVGLSVKTYLQLRVKDIYGAISDGIGWIAIFVGIILIVLGNLVIPSPVLNTAGAVVAILGAVSIIVASSLGSDNKALGAGAGLYNLYGITGYIGDVVSYTRLMALGVSGGSIALAFNMIVGFLPTGARFTVGIVLFLILHAVNFGLSALSAYVHGARLIFVEFFGKFYDGGGKALNPLKTSEEYIDLKNNLETE
ncbi:V-type ATP synthase subunit I [Jeotgalibaca sp. MA1X17-3]|uniref:V-type ATP synthase subunit I n=1 Tax=Jeotgalibaca sp. MA1X17-3 TaxID=2908211 RepID=UPI001F279484|nr:V-type ATP synthase subunit I [Jeotgalibaca sp. MA1X17-3]UJF14954.1 V-type ATP synthase subunit I [Jeotgalibaca sp. MA1X17-3]